MRRSFTRRSIKTMSKQRKTLSIFLAGGLLANSFTIRAFDLWDVLKASAVVVTGVTAAYCAAETINWLSMPNDSTLVSSTPAECRSVCSHYDYWMGQWRMAKSDEAFLYELAIFNWNNNISWSSWYNRIWSDVSTLNSNYQLLQKRARTLETSYHITNQERIYLREIQALIAELAPLVDRMNAFYNYIRRHELFFELAESEWRTNADYAPEIGFINLYGNDQYRLGQELDMLISSHYLYDKFPYIVYVKSLESTIDKLQRARNRVSYAYPNRTEWAERTLMVLRQVRLVIDYKYRYQLLEKQRFDLERERSLLAEERRRLSIRREIDQWDLRSRELEYRYGQLQDQLRGIGSGDTTTTVSFTITT
jgi:hypothetical protein